MNIAGKVHCFFEQSGTFKREFVKLGIPAEDYDIQNNFGETDHVVDLFDAIETAYSGGASLFDAIGKDDLIMAFFPCIYFSGYANPPYFTLWHRNGRNLTMREKFDAILERADNRNIFYKRLYKLVAVVMERGLRLIVENPYSTLGFLHNNFLCEPTLIDMNRRESGDYFQKPTAYWFFGCKPTFGESFTKPTEEKTILASGRGKQAGICSEERSMISPAYARNFICDHILGYDSGETTQLHLPLEGETA